MSRKRKKRGRFRVYDVDEIGVVDCPDPGSSQRTRRMYPFRYGVTISGEYSGNVSRHTEAIWCLLCHVTTFCTGTRQCMSRITDS